MHWKVATSFIAPRLALELRSAAELHLIRAPARTAAAMAPPDATVDAAAVPKVPLTAPDDPHLWLEDVLGEKPLGWVEKVNKDCLAAVGDPKETETYTRIKSILDSKVCLRFFLFCFFMLCAASRVSFSLQRYDLWLSLVSHPYSSRNARMYRYRVRASITHSRASRGILVMY